MKKIKAARFHIQQLRVLPVSSSILFYQQTQIRFDLVLCSQAPPT